MRSAIAALGLWRRSSPSTLVTASSCSHSEVINAYLHGGAGGPNKVVGDYLWKNQRPAFMNAGQWGVFQVLPAGDRRIQPLTPQGPETRTAEAESPGQPALISGPGVSQEVPVR